MLLLVNVDLAVVVTDAIGIWLPIQLIGCGLVLLLDLVSIDNIFLSIRPSHVQRKEATHDAPGRMHKKL